MLLRLFGIILCMALSLSSCGYRWGGDATGAPRRIYVQLIKNDTSRAAFNDQLTNRVIERLVRSASFIIVEDPTTADLLFDGRLAHYTVTPIVYDAADEVVSYRVTLGFSATVRNAAAPGGIFLRADLVSSRDYAANVDRSIQQASERSAAAEVCERLADDLHARLVDELSWRAALERP